MGCSCHNDGKTFSGQANIRLQLQPKQTSLRFTRCRSYCRVRTTLQRFGHRPNTTTNHQYGPDEHVWFSCACQNGKMLPNLQNTVHVKSVTTKLPWRNDGQQASEDLKCLLCEAVAKPPCIIDLNSASNIFVNASMLLHVYFLTSITGIVGRYDSAPTVIIGMLSRAVLVTNDALSLFCTETSSVTGRAVERIDNETNVATSSADVTSTQVRGTVISERTRMAVYSGLLSDYHTFATPMSNVSLGGGCDGGADAILWTHDGCAWWLDRLSIAHVLTRVVAHCSRAHRIEELSSTASGRSA